VRELTGVYTLGRLTASRIHLESTMTARSHRRLAALAVALVVSSLLQGCAVTTGGFVPLKSEATNRSMTSRFDVLRQGAMSRSVMGRMQTTHEKGYMDFRYY
jgi:hypothetical protein